MGVAERNNVVVRGPKGAQPMIFAHGFGCDQNMSRHVAPEFEAAYRVGTLPGYADDVLEICRVLEFAT
jgi:sigma-B regulation protein RsbQ